MEKEQGQDGVDGTWTKRLDGWSVSPQQVLDTGYLYLGPGVPGNRLLGFLILGTGNKNMQSGDSPLIPRYRHSIADLAYSVGITRDRRHEGSNHAFALIAEIPAI